MDDEYVAQAALHFRQQSTLGRTMPPATEAISPEFHVAFQVHADTGLFGASRWVVEALIVAGFNDAEINEQLPMGRELGSRPYHVYRKLFYDIDEYLSRPLAVQTAVFATSAVRNHVFSDCDLTWKLLAYRLKDDFLEFLEGFPTGNFPPEAQKVLRELNRNKLLYHQAHLLTDPRTAYTEESMALISAAKGSWDIAPEKEKDLTAKTLEATVSSLFNSVKVTVLEARTLLNPTEQLRFTQDVRALEARVIAK